MKVAVSSTGNTPGAQVDPRFGRCSFFIVIDSETGEFTAIDNSASGAAGGAGIRSGQNVANTDAEAVITGNVGPNAFDTLKAAELRIFTGAQGMTVMEAVTALKEGKLQEAGDASVGSHAGMGGA